MERQLASIQRIEALRPIDGADTIEVADVLGWHVVVKKGEFNVGDPCVYCEIDSILPEREEFEFLRAKKFRIKTMKLRGQVSQGICFPVGILPASDNTLTGINQDVTEWLGVTKYEPEIPAQLRGKVAGNFPSFLVKTDEERIQSCAEILQHPDAKKPFWVVTEKLDGTSATYFWRYGEFGLCSRNLELKIEDEGNTYVRIAHSEGIKHKLDLFEQRIAIQGEIIGPGIQKNKYNLVEPTIRFFTAFDIDAHRRMSYAEFRAIVAELEIPTVPILDENFILPDTVDELVEYSRGAGVYGTINQREGIVIRHKYQPVSFKVINPDFLLKHED